MKDGLKTTIIIDAIQQASLPFSLPTEQRALATGDHSVKGLEWVVAVERKNPDDLMGCLKNGQGNGSSGSCLASKAWATSFWWLSRC